MSTPEEQSTEAPQTAGGTLTPGEAFAQAVMRQRDAALNNLAQLDVERAQLLTINSELGQRYQGLMAELTATKAELARIRDGRQGSPATPARRRK